MFLHVDLEALQVNPAVDLSILTKSSPNLPVALHTHHAHTQKNKQQGKRTRRIDGPPRSPSSKEALSIHQELPGAQPSTRLGRFFFVFFSFRVGHVGLGARRLQSYRSLENRRSEESRRRTQIRTYRGLSVGDVRFDDGWETRGAVLGPLPVPKGPQRCGRKTTSGFLEETPELP